MMRDVLVRLGNTSGVWHTVLSGDRETENLRGTLLASNGV